MTLVSFCRADPIAATRCQRDSSAHAFVSDFFERTRLLFSPEGRVTERRKLGIEPTRIFLLFHGGSVGDINESPTRRPRHT